MKLRHQIFILVFFVSALVGVTVIVSLYSKSAELSNKLMLKLIADNQTYINQSFANLLFEKSSDIILLSQNELFSEDNDNKEKLIKIEKKFIEIRNAYKNYESIELIDANNVVRVHSSRLNLGSKTNFQDLINQARNTFQPVIDYEIQNHEKVGSIQIAKKISNLSGYVIMAHIPLERLLESLRYVKHQISDVTHPIVLIRTNKNQIVYQSDAPVDFLFDSKLPFLKDMRGHEVTHYERGDYIYSVQNVRTDSIETDLNWEIIFCFKKSELSAPLNQKIQSLAVIWIIGFSFLFLLLNFWVKKYFYPLQSLVEHMQALQVNNMHEFPKVRSHFLEMNQLIFGYNQMLEKLSQSILESNRNGKFAALGQMASGMAHEINNPLMVINGMADKIKRLAISGQYDQITASVEKIEKTVERIAKIIRSLRIYSRDGSHDPMQVESLHEIIFSTLDLCTEKMKLVGIDLRYEKPKHEYKVMARGFQISQIILNLINNAHDAVKSLPDSWIAIKIFEENDFIKVVIENSGPKVSKDIAEKMFTPFFTTKEVGKGTGLGLSLSKGLAELHHGTLALDMSSDHTCFVLKLPDHSKISCHVA